MHPIDRNKLAVLMSFHLLWGLVLWFSISKLGLGISTDSVHLLFGGLNLSEGRGLISFDGSFNLGWPPLYPVLLGAIHLGTESSMFAAAHVLQGISFAGLSLCLSLLFMKLFPDNFALALAGNILSDIGAVVVTSFDLVGSDYVHLFLVMLFVLLAGYYVEHRSRRIFLALAGVGMLAMLERYLGIAAIATGISLAALLSGNLQERLTRSFCMALSALPAMLWQVSTSRVVERREPISFTENFQQFSRSILEWFLRPSTIEAHAAGSVTVFWIVMAGLMVLLFRARKKVLSAFSTPVLLFGLFYLCALFGSASIAYYNKLAGRFLLPLYIPFITLLLISAQIALGTAERASPTVRRISVIGVFGALAVWTALLLNVTVPVVMESHAGTAGGENAFNTADWRANTVLRYWLAHPPKGEYALLSNYPDGIAFYAEHACLPSPRRYAGPYGTVEYPVAGYAGELFSSGQEVYVVWIEPNRYDYYYKPQDLEPIADVEEVFTGEDGGIYRLKPKTGR